MDIYSYYAKFYDQIQESVALFNKEGIVVYCNDAFSVFTGYSIVRFLTKKVTLSTAIKSYKQNDFDINEFIKLANTDSAEIVNIETKAIFRGLAQIAVKKVELPTEITKVDENNELYILSLKDLTLEEELMQSFKSEINNRNKKLLEMNQLIEILQKIRLLDDPYQTINEFINYMMVSNTVCLAGSLVEGHFTKATDLENSLISQDKRRDLVLNQIQHFLNKNKTTKYICYPSDIKNDQGEFYQWSVVPFKFGNTAIYSIFIFETNKQMEDFAHQSAIILSEQLNLILNNLTLKEFAITDGLTGLKNSFYFREQLEHLCSIHSHGQLILFDVDFFKKVNDTYGHLCGDAVLTMLGEKVPQVVKQFSPSTFAQSIIARVGGEEFAIFVPDQDEAFGTNLAEAIRVEIQNTPLNYNKFIVNVTISIGVSSWQLRQGYSNKKVTALYKACDEALYLSKKSGRNQVSVLEAA